MSNSLRGKTAIVTGAGGGIGKGIALLFAQHGAQVLVNDIGRTDDGASAAEKVVTEIRQAGGQALANQESVADHGRHLVQQALDEFGGLDVVVNNAGNLHDRLFHKMRQDEWDAVLEV